MNNFQPWSKITYRVGQHPLDSWLLVLGVALVLLGVLLNIGDPAWAGLLFLAWTGTRRLWEWRQVHLLTPRGRLSSLFDDDGFVQ